MTWLVYLGRKRPVIPAMGGSEAGPCQNAAKSSMEGAQQAWNSALGCPKIPLG